MIKTMHKNIIQSSSQSVFAFIEKSCSDKENKRDTLNFLDPWLKWRRNEES
jgi:hypothetical protein